MEIDPDRPSPFNPLAGNALRSHADVSSALAALIAALGQLDTGPIYGAGALHDDGAAAMELFARPLWGLLATPFADWPPRWSDRLARGLDPAAPEYWGDAQDYDQRIMELGTIGATLCLNREAICGTLNDAQQRQLAAMLRVALDRKVFDNNWHFAPVMIALGLKSLSGEYDADAVDRHLEAVEKRHLGGGWYSDAAGRRVDHYNLTTWHFYALLYCRFAPWDERRIALYRSRAEAFAPAVMHWFADDGAILPFGRSLSYRFASLAFIGACALADVEALPWSVLKGLYLRHLRWWRRWPMTRRDGLLDLGFAHPNALIAEEYLSPASAYWALKAFVPLLLPPDHDFWRADEAPMPAREARPMVLAEAAMMISHQPGNSACLTPGQARPNFRSSHEKYAKFCYSTRYGFSVESDLRRFDACSFDNMIGFADDNGIAHVRGSYAEASVAGDWLHARWSPMAGIWVETQLSWSPPWHIRIHHIRSERAAATAEGGFALPANGVFRIEEQSVSVETASDFSGVVDLSPGGRRARLLKAQPNTHILHPRTVVPQLLGQIDRGETLLACAVLASPDIEAARTAWAAGPPKDIGLASR